MRAYGKNDSDISTWQALQHRSARGTSTDKQEGRNGEEKAVNGDADGLTLQGLFREVPSTVLRDGLLSHQLHRIAPEGKGATAVTGQ